MTRREHTVTKVLVILLLGWALALTGLLGFWLLDARTVIYDEDPRPVVYDNQGLPRTTFMSGETFYVERTFCRRTKKIGTTRRYFINSAVTTLPLIRSFSKEGCGPRRFATEIPLGLHPGEYRYVVTTDYELNPLKHYEHEWTPVAITVTDEDR